MKRSALSGRLAQWTQRSKPTRRGGGFVAAEEATHKLEYLRETDIFSPLSPDERSWLMHNTTMVTCERGRVFYSPGDPGEVVFILKRGKVDLYRLTNDGRKLVIATLGPHTIFGEMGLIGQRMYGCFAEAVEDCLLCILSRSDMKSLARRNPEVALLMLAEVERRLQDREAELEAIAFHGLPMRLATLLLREAGDLGTVDGYTHQDLAERLGTHRETVSSILGKFRSQALISTEAKRICLLDADRLRAIAEPASDHGDNHSGH